MRTIRYENVALLAMAAIFSVVATVVLSGFLEPSQPPAVAAVQIGEPRENAAAIRDAGKAEPARRADARKRADRGPGGTSPRPDDGPAAESRGSSAGVSSAPAGPRTQAPSRAGSPAPSKQRSASPEPQQAPLLPIAPADPDDPEDDAAEASEADDDVD
jgi:hypothetical protein